MLKDFCKTFVRNDTISVGYGIRNLKSVRLGDLKEADLNSISNSVVNETCNDPMQRDIYNNLCPFTYVRRNIQQINK